VNVTVYQRPLHHSCTSSRISIRNERRNKRKTSTEAMPQQYRGKRKEIMPPYSWCDRWCLCFWSTNRLIYGASSG